MPTLRTYDDTTTRKPDVVEVIINITPTETPMLSRFGRAQAKATLHEWLRDSLGSRGDNAVVEGADPTYPTLSSPSRDTNVTQIITKPYQVSDTMRVVDTYGYNDRRAYESAKAMKELSNDINHAIDRGSRASGNSSTARRMGGVLNSVTTTSTTVASGTSLSEGLYNQLLQDVYDEGGNPNETYVGARVKRTISAFTASATVNVDQTSKKRTLSVTTYESDFGVQTILLDRDALQGGSSINSLVALENRMFRTAWLTGRKPKIQKFGKTGDSTKEQWVTEPTLEFGNEAAGGKLLGLNG